VSETIKESFLVLDIFDELGDVGLFTDLLEHS
jgi:hypothetical protein